MKKLAYLLMFLCFPAHAVEVWAEYGTSTKIWVDENPEVDIVSIAVQHQTSTPFFFGIRGANMEDTKYASLHGGFRAEIFYVSAGYARLKDQVTKLDGHNQLELEGGVIIPINRLDLKLGVRHLSNGEINNIDNVGRDFVFAGLGVKL